jgi:general secretion pathway protein D
MDNQLFTTDRRVPGLGRIPGLGWLFRGRKTDRKKTNLMVFIRPTILRDAADARFETGAKYRYIQDLQRQVAEGRVPLMRDVDRPELPPLPEPPLEPSSTDAPADGNQPR